MQVTLTKGFFMGKHEVTQAEYLAVMAMNPSLFTGDTTRPVDAVSWNDAVAYCAALTTAERASGRGAHDSDSPSTDCRHCNRNWAICSFRLSPEDPVELQ